MPSKFPYKYSFLIAFLLMTFSSIFKQHSPPNSLSPKTRYLTAADCD